MKELLFEGRQRTVCRDTELDGGQMLGTQGGRTEWLEVSERRTGLAGNAVLVKT